MFWLKLAKLIGGIMCCVAVVSCVGGTNLHETMLLWIVGLALFVGASVIGYLLPSNKVI